MDGTTGALSRAMVRLTVSLVASARSAPRLMHALRSLTPPLRLRPGHLGCNTWMDSDHTVHYQEDWATEPDMRDRVVSDGFTRLLSVIEASEGLPEVQFNFVTKTRGLDYVAEVRGASGPAEANDERR
jgi:hypothetical protein